jgi:nucleotide-binding universal stress UspA family protein
MFRKILVPLDGSPLAEQALEPALTLAKQIDESEVILFRVPFYQDVTIVQDAYMGVMLPPDVPARAEAEAKSYLSAVQDKYRHPNLKLRSITQMGDEANAILNIADDEEVDLIVMSTHGRTGITRWMLGSITERVLQQAPCPVLVVHKDQPIHNVLVTLDGSQLAETALLPGVEVAEKLGATVTFLTVDQPSLISAPEAVHLRELDRIEPGMSDTILEDLNHQRERYLDTLPVRFPILKNKDNFPFKTVISAGTPAESILDYVAENDVDLIVMATHGRTGLKRWTYGSVTTKVLRRAPCSLLIVRDK